MPPNDSSGAAGFIPSYNAMQMHAGVIPGGVPVPMMPPAPHPVQASMMLQQQAMATQYVTPPPMSVFGSTMAMSPGMFGGLALPPPLMGRAAMARQHAVQSSNNVLNWTKTGVSLGASLLGSGIATTFGGPLGYLAYEGLGVGAAVQRGVDSMFDPIIGMRERGLALQNASTRFVVGGPNLSASGQGLSMTASQQAASGIGRLADSAQFRRETAGMFNRADLDRITRLSGELGMLDQAQSADQIIREVKKVSKALSNFMRIAEEPDVQRAMQQMAKLKTFGFTVPEMGMAAQNARTFARMAGVTIEQAFQAGGAGAAMAQSMGQAGATGFGIGMGALGAARQVAAGLDPRTLSRLGGAEGIQQTLMGTAMQTQMSDHQLAAALTMRNGRLEIDPAALRRLNGMSAAEVARAGSANMRRFGRQGIEQFFARRNELIDDMAAHRSPQEQLLAPLIEALQVQRQLGGTLESALLTMGKSTQEVEALMALARSGPEGMRRQAAIAARERSVARRDEIRGRSTLRGAIRRWEERNIEEPLSAFAASITDPITEHFAEEQDREEALALQGEGPARIISRSRLGSRVQTAAARDIMRGDPDEARRMAARASARAAARIREENVGAERAAALASTGLLGFGLSRLYGAEGFGIDRAGRGGETTRSTIIDAADKGTRIREFFGVGPSAAEVERLGASQERALRAIEDQGGTTRERLQRNREATRGISSSAFAAAVAGMRSYISDQHIGGFVTGGLDRDQMNQAIAAHMRQRGASEAEIRAVTSNDATMNAVTDAFRRSASSSDRQALETMQENTRTSVTARSAQTTDALRRDANAMRESVVERLGMNDFINATAAEKRSVLGLVAGRGADADLRRKVLAAYLMTQSDDEATKNAGEQRLAQLQNEPGYDEAYEAVEASVNAMSDATREDMAARLEGKSSADAEQLMSEVGAQATAALGNEMAIANREVLGEEAARLYESGGVAALRRNPSAVRDENIKRMLRGGASEEEIEAAIRSSTESRVNTEGELDAAGAGDTAADRTSMEGTEAMIAAITEGLEDFPGAVNQLSQASRELAATARELRGASSIAQIAGSIAASSDSSNGFAVGAASAIPFIGPAIANLMR